MQKASGVPDKAYKNLEFLNGREARTIRILSEYAHPQQRFEGLWEDCVWQRDDQLAAEQQALLQLTAAHWNAFVSRLPQSARWRLLSRQAGSD